MTLMTVDFKLLKKEVFIFVVILFFFKLAQYFEVYKLLSLSRVRAPKTVSATGSLHQRLINLRFLMPSDKLSAVLLKKSTPCKILMQFFFFNINAFALESERFQLIPFTHFLTISNSNLSGYTQSK